MISHAHYSFIRYECLFSSFALHLFWWYFFTVYYFIRLQFDSAYAMFSFLFISLVSWSDELTLISVSSKIGMIFCIYFALRWLWLFKNWILSFFVIIYFWKYSFKNIMFISQHVNFHMPEKKSSFNSWTSLECWPCHTTVWPNSSF